MQYQAQTRPHLYLAINNIPIRRMFVNPSLRYVTSGKIETTARICREPAIGLDTYDSQSKSGDGGDGSGSFEAGFRCRATEDGHLQNLAPDPGDQIRDLELRRDLENLLQLFSQDASNNYGISSSYGFDDFGNPEDINKRIEREQEAVGSMPDGHPDKPRLLNNLGNSLLTRFERLGNLDDIDNAIARQQAAVNLTSDGHPHKPSCKL
ncbi:hypothetical protein FRB91_003986 [Serendipita sp. 411]|nr:hypothetical protein FRB91_003986 [Serendipita sp. 411]